MNEEHYAIVVGLEGYPELGDPAPSHLQGPGNDARAVKDWLVDPKGGGVPPGNITLITSPPPKKRGGYRPEPGRDVIGAAFENFGRMAQKNADGGRARRVGERLYVYVSGHGFSPRSGQGCIFAGDASSLKAGANVFVTAWIDWFREAGYFREFVLWMDCCMDRLSSAPPTPPTFPAQTASDAPGPAFIAFAARRSLRAVERQFANGDYHGVFTWNLLEGLRGAAANTYGMVTGRSLADWLRNAQLPQLSSRDAEDIRVSREPEIVSDEESLIFASGLVPRSYNVTIGVPPSLIGRRARVWSGRPARPTEIMLGGATITLPLPPGLHAIDVEGQPWRSGCSVTKETTCDLMPGQAVILPPQGQLLKLDVRPGGGPTPDEFLIEEIFVVDERFHLVNRAKGQLATDLPFGLYKIKLRSGRRLLEKVIVLDRHTSLTPSDFIAKQPAFLSAAPITNTAATHEYHQDVCRRAIARAAPAAPAGPSAQILLVTRTWTPDGSASALEPWNGVQIVDPRGKVVIDPATPGEREMPGPAPRDPCKAVVVAVAPGAYFLRRQLPGGLVQEQTVFASTARRTEVFVLQDADPTKESRLSLFMNRRSTPGPDGRLMDAELRLDQARVSLADGRAFLDQNLEDLLRGKFDDPLAGIVGGHLLLAEDARTPSNRINLLNEVVRNLRRLVGEDHPDVEALSLRCPDPSLRTTRKPLAPPMFEASWRLLAEGSYASPGLTPTKLWRRMHATRCTAPFLSWLIDEDAQRRHREDLARSLGLGDPQPAVGGLGGNPGEVRAAFWAQPAGTPSGLAHARAVSRQLGLPRVAVDALRSRGSAI